jgi:hypothetical protein
MAVAIGITPTALDLEEHAKNPGKLKVEMQIAKARSSQKG